MQRILRSLVQATLVGGFMFCFFVGMFGLPLMASPDKVIKGLYEMGFFAGSFFFIVTFVTSLCIPSPKKIAQC